MLAIMMVGILSVGFTSCSDGDDPEPELKLTPSSIKLAALGEESETFDITCNTSWTIDVDEDWIEVSPDKGKGDETIEVRAEDNTDDIRRTATITVKAGNLERKVKVTQEAGQSLSVSPLNPQLGADKGAQLNITITTNSTWNISGTPSWLTLSATQGSNTTTITMTTTEKNFSENTRSAVLTVVAGTKTAAVTVTQEATFDPSIKVTATNELLLSNGYYADLSFSNVLGYHEGYYYKYAFEVKTEEDIYNEVIEGDIYSADVYNYTIMSGMPANTEFVYCCVPYSGDSKSRKYGKMLIQTFKTKSNSTYCDAAVTGSYNSSYWTYTISKQQRCHHYYLLYATDSWAEIRYSSAAIELALAIRDRIEDKTNYPNYDYFLNDGTSRIARTSGDYAFFLWTWGVDDAGEFSGNIRETYANTSSSALLMNEVNTSDNKELKPIKKLTRQQLRDNSKNLKIEVK